MENVFDHYYLFTKNVTEQNCYQLFSKAGFYGKLEMATFPITDIVITYAQKLLVLKRTSGTLDLPDENKMELRGLAHFNNYQDTILVIHSFDRTQVELFISDECKGLSTIIYHFLNSEKLDAKLNELRSCSKPVKNRNLFINL